MILTNHQHLPDSIVRAVSFSDRNRQGSDYTITELIQPARIHALKAQYADRIEEDVADRIWLLLGSCGHEVLRRAADKSGIVEERALVDLQIDGRMYRISGQIDYGHADACIWDFKFTSVWTARDGARPEWVQQLNCYRWLASKYGVQVDRLEIIAIYRDWSKREAARTQDYPQVQVQVFPVELWPSDKTEAWVIGRIRAHEAAKTELPLCTAEEMWEKPATYAVMKKGKVRAVRVFESLNVAEAMVKSNPEYSIEQRPAVRPRCESYCSVAPFCEQWKAFGGNK